MKAMEYCKQAEAAQEKDHIHHVTTINDKIKNAESVLELFPLMAHLESAIDVDNLKDMLKAAVKKCKISKVRKVNYLTDNIENILPMNVLQHVASLNHVLSIKSISKTFKECFNLNERIELKSRELDISKQLGISEKNTTWQIRLGAALGHEMHTSDSLEDVIKKSQNGDTIILYDDMKHTLNHTSLLSDKSLAIIGNPNDHPCIVSNYFDIRRANLYFKNVEIILRPNPFSSYPYKSWDESSDESSEDRPHYRNPKSYEFMFGPRSFVWIENCTLHFPKGIWLLGNVCITNTTFHHKAKSIIIAKVRGAFGRGKKQQRRRVFIVNCIFEENVSFGSYVQNYPIIAVEKDMDEMDLKIIGNKFINVDGLPFGINDESNFPELPYRSDIHSNVLNFEASKSDQMLKYTRWREGSAKSLGPFDLLPGSDYSTSLSSVDLH